MIIEKSTMKTEAIFSEDRQQRYLLRKEWDSQKKRIMILMTNPSSASPFITDYTTLYTINNLVRLEEFGSVDIVNLTSKCTTKINIKKDIGTDLDDENLTQILKVASKADTIIVAWGRIGENNQIVRALQEKLLEHLKQYADKLNQICDDNGEFGFHPLAPSVRFLWKLIPYEIPKKQADTKDIKSSKKDIKKQLENTTSAITAVKESEISGTEQSATAS